MESKNRYEVVDADGYGWLVVDTTRDDGETDSLVQGFSCRSDAADLAALLNRCCLGASIPGYGHSRNCRALRPTKEER